MPVGGKNTYLAHGTNGSPSSNTDYQDDTRGVNMTFDQETVEATVFGDAYRDHEASFKNATAEVTYLYSTAMWGVLTLIYTNGTTVTFEYGPDGATAPKPKITGSWFITKLGMPTQVGNLIEVSVSYQITGAVTFGAYA